MRKPIMHGIQPFPMLIFTSVMVITLGLVFQFLGILTAAPLFGFGLAEIFSLEPGGTLEHLAALKYIQIIGALGTFIFSSLLLSFLYTGDWLAYFTLHLRPGGKEMLILTLVMIAGLPLVNFLTEWNGKLTLPVEGLESFFRNLDEETEQLMMQMLTAKTSWGLFLNIFMIAIIPAVGEELVFRGLIQRHLSEWFRNPHAGILVASVIFSLVHFQLYSFLPRFYLGMVMGYLFYYGKSLWYPILAHFINNGVGVVFYYLLETGGAEATLDEIGTPEMMPMMAIYSAIIVGGLMWAWIAINRISRSARSAWPRTGSDH